MVRVLARRRRGTASVAGRDEAQIRRAENAMDLPAGRKEIHLDESAPLRRKAHGGGAAGKSARRVCVRTCRRAGAGQGGPGQVASGTGSPVLHAGAGGGTRNGNRPHLAAPVSLVRRAGRADQGRRHAYFQRRESGIPPSGRTSPKVTGTSMRREARSAIGSRSRTARSRGINASCRARGIARRATARGSRDPTKPR